MKKTAFCFFLIILTGCRGEKGDINYTPEIEGRISQVENNLSGWVQTGTDDRWNIWERMKKYGVKGLSIAVVNDYKIEWARGYGYADESEKRPVTSATLFQAASISKSLNSLGLLKLVQEGTLDPDADINDYLKSWKFPYDNKSGGKKITIKELLSHTGGLSVHGFPGYEPGSDLPNLPQILDGVSPANTEPVRSVAVPGESVIYSGGGTTISQLMLMDITGETYEKFMQENVLDPLGMNASFYSQPPAMGKRRLLATGYRVDGREVEGKFHVYPEQAAAGLWTNPTDLCRYIIETQLALRGESSQVLNQEMTIFRLKPVMEDAALGTFINSRVKGSFRYFNHNGANEGFSCTSVGCLDNGYGVVIMTNSDNRAIIDEIANSVATVYNWKDYYLPEVKTVIEVKEELFKLYTGKYSVDNELVEVKIQDSVLVLMPGRDFIWRIYFTSDSDFFIREMRGTARFRTDAGKKVTGFTDYNRFFRKVE